MRTYFIDKLENFRKLTSSQIIRGGEKMTCLLQHPLLACSREARSECILGWYYHKKFQVSDGWGDGCGDRMDVGMEVLLC
jgi:hypothetical protein